MSSLVGTRRVSKNKSVTKLCFLEMTVIYDSLCLQPKRLVWGSNKNFATTLDLELCPSFCLFLIIKRVLRSI